MSGAVRMTWLFAFAVLSSIYSVKSECPSCNISHPNISQVESWTFTVQNGIGTAHCCPRRGALAGSYLYWPNGSDIIRANYSSSGGCEAISVLLTDEHCGGIQVMCRTSWGNPVQKENISTELKPCSSLFSSSNNTDLLQMCLNCTDEILEGATSTDSHIIKDTTSAVSGAIVSSVSTFMAAGQINHAYVSAFAVVAILLSVAIAAIIVVVVVLQHKNRKKANNEVKQAEEGTGLLNNPERNLNVLGTSANLSSKETAIDSQVPVQQFANNELCDHEPPSGLASVLESSEDSQSSPLEQSKGGVQCSQSVNDLAAMVIQTTNKLLLPQSQVKNSDIVRCIPENDTRIKFSRSLSYPNSST